MQIEEVSIDHLCSHPANSNVMGRDRLAKLRKHIERTDRYPPLIVRRLACEDEHEAVYQILDGHHRWAALKHLGRSHARCVVWEVDDDEALILLATLNRLEGEDDPGKRAQLLERLCERMSVEELARHLPERIHQIEKLLTLAEPPRLCAPTSLAEMPVAVHFFLLPDQRDQVERTLKRIGGGREEALLAMVRNTDNNMENDAWLAASAPNGATE